MRSLVAIGAVAATATALAAAPAFAEPIGANGKAVTPQAYDIVGGGSATTQYVLDQLTANYNKTVKKHSPTNPYILSWDAVPPSQPLNTAQLIQLKNGCPKPTSKTATLRPNGSSSGIADLISYPKVKFKGKTYNCLDFARSSRGRKPGVGGDPSGPGGVVFVTLAGDAVTYASDAKSTNVPNNLNRTQLAAIFGCNVPAANGFGAMTWGALLGSKAKNPSQVIDPILPQAGSGTLSFWATTALGLTSTNEPTCGSRGGVTNVNQEPEENEGISPFFKGTFHGESISQNVIYPFSIGSFVAQSFHSKTCGKAPKRGQNTFGCNEVGVFKLNGIAGVAPTVKTKSGTVTNGKFPNTFHRFIYDVVPYYGPSADHTHIPPKLEKFFGKKGVFCASKDKSVLQAYGFEPTLACGFVS
jgi:ABC-type phosphate transport system substrate-binding protein